MVGLFYTQISVMFYMHFYACPICWADGKYKGKLTVVKSEYLNCDCKEGFFTKDKECKKEDYKCKVVMECGNCMDQFKISEKFLREEKMKIKDG